MASTGQSLADRSRGDFGDVHGGARHLDRRRGVALYCRQSWRDAERSDLGADQLSGVERHRASGQRLVQPIVRAETASAGLHQPSSPSLRCCVGSRPALGCLVVARVLQGVGGGVMQPLSQSILLESFPPAKRGAAMAVYGFGVIFAPIIGPTLGGWLTDAYSWRWIFLINLPVGVLSVFMVLWWVEDPPYIRAARPGRIDGIGFALMALWLGTLQITLDKGQEVDWFSAVWLRWFVVISALAMLGFIVREMTTEHPIVDLRILKNRNFAVGSVMYAMFGAALYAMIALQPLFLQSLLHYTAFDSGLTVSPRGFGSFFALLLVGRLVARVSQRLLVAVGFLILALSAFWFSRMNLQVSMSSIVPVNILNGFGAGFVFVPLTTVSLGMLRNEQMANATGIQNLMRNIGSAVGLSFVSTMLERYAQAHQMLMVGHLSPLNPVYHQRLAFPAACVRVSLQPCRCLTPGPGVSLRRFASTVGLLVVHEPVLPGCRVAAALRHRRFFAQTGSYRPCCGMREETTR